MTENKNIKWKGNDASLTESIDSYGFVYQYDGENFHGWSVCELDDEGKFVSFAPFFLDNEVIDEYFDENGEKIADMCGVTPEEMDYEWKMDALLSYYGAYEFTPSMYGQMSRDELFSECRGNWFGSED